MPCMDCLKTWNPAKYERYIILLKWRDVSEFMPTLNLIRKDGLKTWNPAKYGKYP